MRQFLTKLLIVGMLVCLGIFLGVDLATNGLNEIQGTAEPVVDVEETAEAPSHAEQPEPDEADDIAASPIYDLEAPGHNATLVNVLADAAGNVLQRTARGSIELIVSMFDGILH